MKMTDQSNISFYHFNRFYADTSAGLDEHNRTHISNNYTKSVSDEVPHSPAPISTIPKLSDTLSHTSTPTINSEKSTPPSKAKVHRCRQCSFVSSVKVCPSVNK